MADEGSSRRVTSPLGRHQSPKGCDRERERDRDRDTDRDRNKENWNRGPRSLFLKRSENGFGFTLRHFIVYPPESYTVLSRDRCLGLRGGEWDEPMDTIFVKHVRPNSPASIAGLATGDRIVSVNGETICGKSYAHVVQLIHQSPSYLHLLVVPKEDDILQLYFGETAHNPETNPRPRLRSPEMVSGVGDLRQHGQQSSTAPSTHHSRLSTHQQQQQQQQQQQLQLQQHGIPAPYHNMWDDVRFHSPQRISCNINAAGGRRSSEGSRSCGFVMQTSGGGTTTSVLPTDRYGSSESMPNYIPPNMPGCRLSLDGGIIGHRDSHSRDSSASSLDSASRDLHSSDDSLIINRIRKSFEQKEEFLKRPAVPIWVGGGPELIPQKEFYARPQKLGPVWPPTIPASPHHSPARKSISNDEIYVERGGFVCGGAVTNVPNQDLTRSSRNRNTSGFVTTLGRIQENGKIIEPLPQQSISASPLQRIVSHRARQFESGRVDDGDLPDRTSLYKSELARLSEKRSNPNVAVRKREFEAKSERKGFSNRESRSLDSAVIPSGTLQQTSSSINRQVVPSISSSSLPTPVPSSSNDASSLNTSNAIVTTCSSSLNTNTLSSSGVGVLSGNRTIPIGNYKLHCEPPPTDNSGDNEQELSSSSFDSASPVIDKETDQSRPRSNSAESSWLGNSWPHRHKAVRQDSYLQACQKPIRTSVLQDDESKDIVTPLASPNLVALSRTTQNENNLSVVEDDKGSRRVSYLKATWNDRMNVDSEPDISDSETQHRTPQSVPVSRTSLCVSDLGDKENHRVIKEGNLHCKLTLVDGKRASDRSWKQVWAVLKGPILYLYKERRDSIPSSETPIGTDGLTSASSGSTGSCEQVDMRCALVAAADNYTKRKHVLRLNTLSGSELLLQAEDAGQMARWIFALQEQANNNNTTDGITSSSLSPIPTHKSIKKLTSLRNRSPTGQSPVNKTRKPIDLPQQPQSQQLPSPKTKTWKGRVAKQFKRIGQGAGSPVSPTAPDNTTGVNSANVYPEGATIGIPLEDCPMSSTSEYVPLLVELCTGIVEARGLEIIGIYRVPGNTAAVSSLTEAVNKGLDASVLEQDPRWSDVNVISSLLKSFFRRLPDSLLTSELYPLFIQADKIEDPVLRIVSIRKLVHALPDHHYETLRYLMQHLKRVVDHCAINKMEARNLAIVFGPTLIRTGDDNMVTMVTDMSHQCRIVETLILHVEWCFSDNDVDQLNVNIVSESTSTRPGSQADDPLLNHNLLLGNIHKVEGMKYDCATKEISAKDIVSSIICAANRKMQKAKSKKATSSTSSMSQSLGTSEDTVDNQDAKQSSSVLLRQRFDNKAKALNRKERVTSASDDIVNEQTSLRGGPASSSSSNVASSIRESILFSGNIANKLPIDDETSEDVKHPESTEQSVIDEEGAIKTYTGLSSATQERIRRFEMETKAMLHRDASRTRLGGPSKEENREWERQRIDREWQQAKRELEVDDILDRIADNPSAIAKKIADQGESTRRDLTAEGTPHQCRNEVNLDDVTNTILTGDNTNSVVQPSSNLKRLKTGREQKSDLSFNASGSLDSLQGSSGSDRPNSHASDDGGDLLISLTSTFDAKMRSLLSSNSTSEDTTQSDIATISPPLTPPTMTNTINSTAFRDPSLHRGSSVERSRESTLKRESKKQNLSDEEKAKANENKTENVQSSNSHCGTEEGCGEKPNGDNISNKENIAVPDGKTTLTKMKKCGDEEFNIEKANLRRSESLNRRDEKKDLTDVCKLRRSESLNKGESGSYSMSKLKRSESLNKSELKLKRSDSLTKNEKTESNLNKRRQLEASRWSNVTKLKRKNGVLSERSIKRRHTVGGTKDFDKVNWLDNRQREAENEISRKERRTSSPDLSSSRLAGILVEVVLRPHSIADSNLNSRLFNVPLESHV
ncbi:rho GTPase activating protein at 19D isoform X2 [Lycorma delicatula]|uniref:rho GTPase activating protein at 19D isoform X2 n=1 Tax=Lycorma delicatula TaxID=130591 RepID=UPI003F50FE74